MKIPRVSKPVMDQAFQEAVSNGMTTHVGAFLFRGGSYITYGTNDRVTHPERQGWRGETRHAETRVLHRARRGDVVLVVRWFKSGQRAPISPCIRCASIAGQKGVTLVVPPYE